jgi:uncharacterized protein (TIGR00290 family)
MIHPKRVVVSWSSGKDSAWALARLRADPSVEVVGLFTIMSAHQRVFMHAVRREIVQAQAKMLGLPLHEAVLPEGAGHDDYEQMMHRLFLALHAEGATHICFGDLYLEDVRQHRLTLLANTGLEPLFPLWMQDTRLLAAQMLAGGIQTYITCVDPKKIDRSFIGRRWNDGLIAELPPGSDPCGEHGEFHTCVVGGPMFSAPLPVELGEIVEREGYLFADLTLRR